MRRAWLLIAAVGGVAALLWLLLAGDESLGDGPLEATPAEQAEVERIGAMLRGTNERASESRPAMRERAVDSSEPPAASRDPERFLYVHVLGPDGVPVEAAQVMWTIGSGPKRRSGLAAGERGWFVIERERIEGPLRLGVFPPRTPKQGQALAARHVEDVDTRREVVVVALEAARELRGFVVDDRGEPQGDVDVWVYVLGEELRARPPGAYHGRPWARVRSNAEGRFSVPGLPWLPVTAHVQPRGPNEEQQVISLGTRETELRVLVAGSRVLRVVVMDPDGRAVEGAQVLARGGVGDGAWWLSRRTDAHGQCEFVGLRHAEPIRVSAHDPAGGSDTTVREVSPHAERVELQLEPGVSMSGTLLRDDVDEEFDPDFDRLQELLAIPVTPGRTLFNAVRRGDYDPETHAFRFRGLRPGDYRLVAVLRRGIRGGRERLELGIHRAPARGLTLRPVPNREVRGRVLGDRLGSLFVSWTDGHTRRGAGAGKKGAFVLSLPVGRAGTVYAHDSEGTACAVQQLGSEEQGPLTLRLVPGESIRGRVQLPAETTAIGLAIRVQSDSFQTGARLKRDLSWHTPALPPGSYRLVLYNASGGVIAEKQAKAGQDGVVLGP